MSDNDLDDDDQSPNGEAAGGPNPAGAAPAAKKRRARKGGRTKGLKASPAKASPAKDDEDDHVVDLEEELHPDDVEDALDVLLQEKTASEGLDVDEAEIEADDAEPGERGANRIAPRQADEFLCSSCFLVVPLSQLADKKRQLCRDCA
ncbi:MAG TPA: DUF4193 family protein [Acidimicrobiia bacterium]|nr:DUF4193 family protein [Acidimicrobiia bacterium]